MTDVVMPKMGESLTEGTILEWKKQVGDTIEKDETLLEISTDKVDSEVPSPAAGVILEILNKVNEVVAVGEVIAKIGVKGEAGKLPEEKKPAEFEPTTVEKEKPDFHPKKVPLTKLVDKPPTTEVKAKSGRFYSPLVKSIAKKEGITQAELEIISGSGNNGRVNKKDILAYLASRLGAFPVTQTEQRVPPEIPVAPLEDKVEPMGRVRQKIAQHMVSSQEISAHVYSTSEADVSNMVNIRAKFKESYKERTGVNLTYTPMIIDACIRAIEEFPLMNASIDNENIVHHRNINIGVAVALPDNNLIVPVIQAAEERNFLGLARSTADLAARARQNKLTPGEIFGSTFTVTNPGIFGGLFGMGIINQPNLGILSVGAIQKKPVVKETEYGDAIVIRHMMYLTLGYDHRLIDGAYGTRFLTRVVELIESYDETRISG